MVSKAKQWERVNLSEICSVLNGFAFKSTYFNTKTCGLPLIRIRDVKESTISTYFSGEYLSEYIISNGDILIGMDGDFNCKKWQNIPALLNQRVCKIEIFNENYNKNFLYYALPAYLNEINVWSSAVTVKHLSSNSIKEIPLPLPPLNEQKRIVAKLDKIIPRIDSVKTRLDRVPTIIKRFRQSILTAAVTGKLTEKWREEHLEVESAEVLLVCRKYKTNSEFKDIGAIPEKWCWCALGNYAQLSRGRFSIRPRNDPRYFNGNYPFIQIGDLPREGGYVNAHKQTLNEKGLKVSKEFKKNTVAIAIVGATIGNTGILSYKMCFPDSLIGIETKTKFASVYTEYYLRTEKDNIRNISYASGGQPNIKLPTLTDYPFPLPPLEEQQEIVRQADKLFALADKLEAHYQKAKTHVGKLSQAVLAKAFRGELVPQDPNDEPAEELLARIMEKKNEKSQRPAAKRTAP